MVRAVSSEVPVASSSKPSAKLAGSKLVSTSSQPLRSLTVWMTAAYMSASPPQRNGCGRAQSACAEEVVRPGAYVLACGPLARLSTSRPHGDPGLLRSPECAGRPAGLSLGRAAAVNGASPAAARDVQAATVPT